MDIRASLAALCGSDGPSGREDQVAEVALSLLRPLVDEGYRDKFGNVIGVRRCGKEDAKRVVLDAHLDEVGLVITGAKEGFLSFRAVGGIDPRMLPNREVTILSQPPRFGLVAVLPPHVQQPEDANKSTPLSDLYIDAGLTQEEGEALVGTFVVPKGPFRSLLGERVSAKALDDRAGFAALLQTAEYLQGKPLDVDLYLMGSTREEVNGSGALVGAYALRPHCFVAVDVTHARTPDGPKEETFGAGQGTVIGIGPNITRWMSDRLIGKAEALVPGSDDRPQRNQRLAGADCPGGDCHGSGFPAPKIHAQPRGDAGPYRSGDHGVAAGCLRGRFGRGRGCLPC